MNVTISAEHPTAIATLRIPKDSLGCDNGWWSAPWASMLTSARTQT